MPNNTFWKDNCVVIKTLVIFLVLFPIYRLISYDQPLTYVVPNVLLFTSYRELTRSLWEKYVVVDKNVYRHPEQIPIIEAKDYTFETLRAATKDFRQPALVKGLFSDTPATTKWIEPGYLSKYLGKFNLPVVTEGYATKAPDDKTIMGFDEAFTHIVNNQSSMYYIFFPVKSRFHAGAHDVELAKQLQEVVNNLSFDDLHIDEKIWNGFGRGNHKNYHGSQLIIGRGRNELAETTGRGWHCAAGSNYFIQVRSSS